MSGASTRRRSTPSALQARKPAPTPTPPRFQAVFCLDEREESFRRHLEELAPDAVTFGTAGFYSIAMYYRGATDAHFVPLCPANDAAASTGSPSKWWTRDAHQPRARTRRRAGDGIAPFHGGQPIVGGRAPC